MLVKDLKSEYYMFGNKGALWSDEAHISKSGIHTTLCGSPMLSTNWCGIEDVKTIGCPKCIEIYKQQTNG